MINLYLRWKGINSRTGVFFWNPYLMCWNHCILAVSHHKKIFSLHLHHHFDLNILTPKKFGQKYFGQFLFGQINFGHFFVKCRQMSDRNFGNLLLQTNFIINLFRRRFQYDIVCFRVKEKQIQTKEPVHLYLIRVFA